MTEADISALMTDKATRDSMLAQRPASPDAYKYDLPADFVVPQGVEFKLDTQDPLLAQARQVMHDIDQGRLSGQAAFSKLLGLYGGVKIAELQGFETYRAKQWEKLGPTSAARRTAVDTFLTGMLGDAKAAEMKKMLVTADIIEGFETLMGKFASQGGGTYSHGGRISADTNEIPGYENMSFMQRRAAQDALRAKQGQR